MKKNKTIKTLVVFLGPPGVGKGTIAGRLADELGYEYVSSGDLLRSNVSRQTDLGLEAKKYVESGKLVPDEMVARMVFDHLGGMGSGVFLDGFPRTVPQADELSAFLTARDIPLLVIDLDASDDFLRKRLAGRLICRQCGKIYHRVNMPPARDGRCDRCGGLLSQRNDDQPEVVQHRLDVYHRESAPVRIYYGKREILHTIAGDTPLEETMAEARKLVKKNEALRTMLPGTR